MAVAEKKPLRLPISRLLPTVYSLVPRTALTAFPSCAFARNSTLFSTTADVAELVHPLYHTVRGSLHVRRNTFVILKGGGLDAVRGFPATAAVAVAAVPRGTLCF